MPKFVVKVAGRPEMAFAVEEDDIFIGRVPTINDICIHDPSVSRQHAHVKRREEGYTIYDLKSLNGVLLNGTRVSRAVLKHGDSIRLGDVEVCVEMKVITPEEEMAAIEESETTLASQGTSGLDPKDEVTRKSKLSWDAEKTIPGRRAGKPKKP